MNNDRIRLAIGGVVLIAGLVTGITSSASSSSPSIESAITISAHACGPNVTPLRSGRSILQIANTDSAQIFGVELVGADQVSVYGEIDMLAPGTSRPLDVVLTPGRYSLLCESFSGSNSYSPAIAVAGGSTTGARPFVPVTSDQIALADLQYRTSLTRDMQQLVTDTDVLKEAIVAGDLNAARTDWLPAHLDYERLGAAYDTFGNFDDEINGRPFGLVGGVNDPKFQGFFRLEYGLWHGQSASELMPIAQKLTTSVAQLLAQFPQMLMPANDLSLRTHEILENTLQFELTGATDEGSHTNLATAWANVQGTQIALAPLAPLIATRDPVLLKRVQSGLAALGEQLRTYDHNGSWVPLSALSTTQHETVDGAVSSLLEQLSSIPDLLELPIRPDTSNE